MATGIRDKVAIIGMGCTRFGERWDVGAEELMVESFTECVEDAGIDRSDIQAAWLGTCYDEINVGKSALPLSMNLRLPFIPVTRTENYCASGTEAFRGAVYAVASGAYDICLALGVEKLKDTGFGGLPSMVSSTFGSLTWLWNPNMTAPGSFAQLATAYAAKHRIPEQELKRAMAQVSVKSHENGALNPKAHLRRPVSIEQVMAAPIIAYPLGLFDCCGVSDGSACAIVTTPEIAKSLKPGQDIVKVKALQISDSSGEEAMYSNWDGAHFVTTRKAAQKAYEEAGIANPREEITMMEVHDCFSITEMITMEDLHISPKGGAIEDVMSGFYDLDGQIPCQVDGGLKCFGHPIGASGLRMLYAMYEQILDRVPEERKVKNARMGLTHNLGGLPWMNVASIAIIGRE